MRWQGIRQPLREPAGASGLENDFLDFGTTDRHLAPACGLADTRSVLPVHWERPPADADPTCLHARARTGYLAPLGPASSRASCTRLHLFHRASRWTRGWIARWTILR